MERLLSPFRVLKLANFRWLTIGMFISFIGSQMQTVGISWHLYQLTHSAFSLGFIGLAGVIPVLLLSPVSGLIVDAFDRKKVLILDQVLLTIINVVFAILTFVHHDSPMLIYVVIVLNAMVNVVDLPARQTIIPSVVPKESLIQALNVFTIARQTSLIIGPAIAGLVIGYFNVSWVYMMNAVSFVFLFFALLPLALPHAEKRKEVPFSIHSILEGVRYIKDSPILYASLILDFFANFFAASTVIFPIFAAEVLHIPPHELGLLYAAPSVGSVITGLLVGYFAHFKHQGKLLLWAVVVYSFATVGFGLSKWLPLSLVCLAIVGGADMVSMVVRRTISQLVTPDHLRGRMNSLNMIFFIGGPFLGEAEAGFAAGLLGAPLSVVLGGLGAALSVAGIAYWISDLREYVHENTHYV